MLIVHKYGPAWGTPDISPFVVKLETYLRLAGIPYEGKPADPRKAPKQKLPYVDDDGTVLGDSRLIIEHLEQRRGISLDAHLAPGQRSVATAFQSMLEEHLYFVIVHDRWKIDANWQRYLPTMRQILSGAVPGPLTGLVAGLARKQMLKALSAQGTGRHTPDEVGRIGQRIVGALAEQIGDGPFFFGAEPATIDATAYAFLLGILEAPFEGQVSDAVRASEGLKGYVERIKKRCWS